MTSRVKLPHEVALELAYALASHVATSASIRLLAIKGIASSEYGLRAARFQADIDVLVSPDDLFDFLSLMNERGWHPRPAVSGIRQLPYHSVTLIHDAWPCDIDVHWYFPGVFAEPAFAFDKLWARRVAINVGGVALAIPDEFTSALITVLHSKRGSRSNFQHDWEFINAIHRLSDADTISSASALICELDAHPAFGEALDGIKCLVEQHPNARRNRQRWEYHLAALEAGSPFVWLSRRGGDRISERLRMMLSAIHVSDFELQVLYGHKASRFELYSLRFRHLTQSWRKAIKRIARYRLWARSRKKRRN